MSATAINQNKTSTAVINFTEYKCWHRKGFEFDFLGLIFKMNFGNINLCKYEMVYVFMFVIKLQKPTELIYKSCFSKLQRPTEVKWCFHLFKMSEVFMK